MIPQTDRNTQTITGKQAAELARRTARCPKIAARAKRLAGIDLDAMPLELTLAEAGHWLRLLREARR